MHWQTARFRLTLARPLVMGIVNLTPDSFSADGHCGEVPAAVAHCERLVQDGADILDLGAESTRPGATPVGTGQELDRLMPVLERAVKLGVPISVDTSRPEVIVAALAAGADIINDVRALRLPGAWEAWAASASAGACLMHLRGEPRDMQAHTEYHDVVAEVAGFLQARLDHAVAAGVALDRIVVDPGIGFAKTPEQNWVLMRRQDELRALGRPILVGWSRKSTLGRLTGRDAQHRLGASVAAALAAVSRGAEVVRVHDVAETVDALRVWQASGLIAGRQ